MDGKSGSEIARYLYTTDRQKLDTLALAFTGMPRTDYLRAIGPTRARAE